MKNIFILAIALLLLAGCATSSDRQFTLTQTLLLYEKSMRWNNFANLLNFRESATDQEVRLVSSYENIRISGYKTLRQHASQDELTVNLDVEISYFRTNDNRIISIIDRQTWEYDNDKDHWYIISPLPVFQNGS